jgi:predicted PurR-regulated permease PerM
MNINLPRLLVIELIVIASGVIVYFAGGLLSKFGHLALILAFSILLTYALLPAVDFFAKFKLIPRGLSILIVYVLMFLGLATFIALISVPASKQVGQFARNYPKYVEQFHESIPRLQQQLDQRQINYDLDAHTDELVVNIENNATNAVTKTGSIITGFFGTLSTLFFILFVTAYFLHSGDKFAGRIISLFPKRRQRLVRKLATDYDRILGSFVRGQLLIALIVAVTVGIFTTIIGLPYSVIIGLIAGITALIPVIGALLGVVLPIIIAAFVKPILIPIFLVFFIILNEFTDKFLYPRIVGKAVELHPLLVLFALLVGVSLAGIAGALLATPVLALIKTTTIALRNTTGYAKVQ